ncbi:MAG: hypothetical protein JRJ77_19345 [Deltaproteobacteria bacterium]|nr:hypothetical protein [Deltaproteobacteria bacterium]MBW1794409.1 hypothetical protein [Deltaproteobacteria bacterium]
MAVKNVYEAVKTAMQDLMAPQLESIKSEIVSVKADIRRLDDKMDISFKGVDEKLDISFKGMDEKSNSLRNELKADIGRIDEKLLFTNKRLDEALDIRERLAILEAKIGK